MRKLGVALGVALVLVLVAALVSVVLVHRGSDGSSSDRAVHRLQHVPDSPEARRRLRVLTDGCPYDARGIPACGVLLGAAYGANADPAPWEASMGHSLGVHRTYYAADHVDDAITTAQSDLDHLRIPWLSFKPPRSWEQMAQGDGDSWARGLARRLAALDGPVWLAISHEPEGDGDIRHWTAMQEHLAPLVRSTAPNVAYSVILTGYNELYGAPEYALSSLWPHTRIDLVGFDVYDKLGTEKDGRLVDEHTDFTRSYFPQFRAFARKHDLAWALAETGQTDAAAAVDPDFVSRLVREVGKYDGVAVSYFNSTTNANSDWALTGAKEDSFAAALRLTPTL